MKLMLRSARALLAAAAAPRHVLVLLGADVDCPCRRHDHPRQNALVNYAGCRPGAHSAHPAACGCWWPLESSGAETSLLHDHAERHVLWRLSRGSHAAVHALMQRSSSRASSERDDSSTCPQGTRPRMLALSQTALRALNRALRALKGCCRKELSL